jgi:hypothetical protein
MRSNREAVVKYTILALVLIASLAFGQPSITTVNGTISNGESISIGGSGFGYKGNAAPLLWDRVTNQSAYSSLAAGDEVPVGCAECPWDDTYMDTSIYYQGGSPRTAGGGHYRAVSVGGLHMGSMGEVGALYISWWVRSSSRYRDGGSNKLIRLWDNPSGTAGRVSWTTMHNTWREDLDRDCVLVMTAPSWGDWGGVVGTWTHHTVELDNTDIDCGGGTYRARTNNTLLHETEYLWAPEPYSIIHHIGIDTNEPATYPTETFDFTDVYIDTVLARVEIGNASTYAASTVLEVQPATAWSATAITITGSVGGLDGSAWLYVTDRSGTNSAGYLVEIDGEEVGSDTPVAIATASRTGNTLSVTITPPSESATDYVVWVAEADVWRRGYIGGDTSASIIVDDTADLRVYVVARDSDGTVLSTSGETRLD